MAIVISPRPAALLLALLLASCSLMQRPSFQAGHEPHALVAAQQQWHLSLGGENYHLQALLELDDSGLRAVVMDSLGRRLVTLNQQQGVVHQKVHQRHPAKAFWPRLMESLQFIFWPLADLQNAQSTSWRFHETAQGHRQISFDNKVIGSIEYRSPDPWQGESYYLNEDEDFALLIESRKLREAPL